MSRSGSEGLSSWGRRSLRAALDIVQDSRLGASGTVQVGVELEVHPEGLRGAEVLGQAKRRTRGNTPTSVHDLVDPLIRHMEGIGKVALANAHRLEEFLQEDLSRMRGWSVGGNAGHWLLLSRP